MSALVEIAPRYPEVDAPTVEELERAKAELEAEAPNADSRER